MKPVEQQKKSLILCRVDAEVRKQIDRVAKYDGMSRAAVVLRAVRRDHRNVRIPRTFK